MRREKSEPSRPGRSNARRSHRRTRLRGCLALLGSALSVLVLLQAPLHAASTRALGLRDMVERAGRIFLGQCVERTVSTDAATGIPVTTYTFRVVTSIKGVSGERTTFRIPGTPEHPFLDGLAVFEPGETALLLLYPESPAGFSTPLGLDQGRFRLIEREGRGTEVVNGRGNARVLTDVPAELLPKRDPASQREQRLELDVVLDVVRSLVAEDGG